MQLFTKRPKIGCKFYIVLLFFFFSSCFISPLLALPVNSTAPNFTLLTLDGTRTSLSEYRGKVVILKLGTTWCPGCRDQDKELQQIDGFLKEAGITVIEVFLDDPAEEVRSYQRQYDMKSMVVTLFGDGRLLRDYSVHAIPRLIILSTEQKVLSDATGMTAPQIKAQILQNNKKVK